MDKGIDTMAPELVSRSGRLPLSVARSELRKTTADMLAVRVTKLPTTHVWEEQSRRR